MRILSVGIFTFEARDVNYLATRAFITGKIEENPQTDPELMYGLVNTWLEENKIDGLIFSDKYSLDIEFYKKGGIYNMSAYGRPSEGDIINVFGTYVVVTNTGMFSFDIIEYEEK
jgi:hypothetical protein